MNGAQYALETSDPAKRFWPQSGLLVEELGESVMAQPYRVEDRGYSCGVWIRAETPGRKDDCRMQLKRADQLLKKGSMGNSEHLRCAFRLEQLFAHSIGASAPDTLERKIAILGFRGRDSEEWKGTAGSELNPEDPFLLERVDDKRLRARSRQNRFPEGLKLVRIFPVINAYRLISKVEDDAGLSGRHQPLFGMGDRCALAIPETLHELRQRGGRHRLDKAPIHGTPQLYLA